jgi:hypothetical protein
MIRRLKRRGAHFARQILVRLLPQTLPQMGEQIMQLATYYPHAHTTYSVPIYRDEVIRVPNEPLPIPPRHPILGQLLHIRLIAGCRVGRMT